MSIIKIFINESKLKSFKLTFKKTGIHKYIETRRRLN